MKNPFSTIIITSLLFVFLLSPTLGIAQSGIILTNTKTDREIHLKQGIRVAYVLTTKSGSKAGKLNYISRDSITVGDTKISLEEIKAIGQKKGGANLVAGLMASFGGAMIGEAIKPDEIFKPCSNCQPMRIETGTETRLLYGGIGATLVVLAMKKSSKNSVRNVKKGLWRLEVVD